MKPPSQLVGGPLQRRPLTVVRCTTLYLELCLQNSLPWKAVVLVDNEKESWKNGISGVQNPRFSGLKWAPKSLSLKIQAFRIKKKAGATMKTHLMLWTRIFSSKTKQLLANFVYFGGFKSAADSGPSLLEGFASHAIESHSDLRSRNLPSTELRTWRSHTPALAALGCLLGSI